MGDIGFFRRCSQGYSAFFPAPFPPPDVVQWNGRLVNKLSDADFALGKLVAVEQWVPDMDFFISMYASKEATLSSQIEGTQATLGDYLRINTGGAKNDKNSDAYEIVNYLAAMNDGLEKLKELPLSWRLLREMHRKLLSGAKDQRNTPGEFRRSQNWIGGRKIQEAVFVPPPPQEMKAALSDLETFFYENKKGQSELPVLIKAALIHAQFETIHPFLDGNGRLGRILITFFLIKEKVLSRPILYLSEYFKSNRRSYYERLNGYRDRDREGVQRWIEFFLEGVCEVSEDAVDKVKRIMELREKNLDVMGHFGKNVSSARQVLDRLYKNAFIDAKTIEKITGIKSRTNIHKLISKFVDAKILEECDSEKKKGKIFVHKEYYRLFDD